MSDFQTEKTLVLKWHRTLEETPSSRLAAAARDFLAEPYRWRGYHPFDEITGSHDVIRQFWIPLKSSLHRLQRREDIFFAGLNEIDGFESVWVVSMGHLFGLFDQDWLGIPATGKMAFLRYCEFHRVEDGRIAETAMFFDIPHLMIQCGLRPFPHQTAAHLVQPGPAPHDGLLREPQPPDQGKRTLALINAMLTDLGQWRGALPLEEELARTWQDDMIWWGPAGIGATYTIERYAKQHAGPFRAAFEDRSQTGHVARLAEGHYGGFFGWPNFTARLSKDFMGLRGNGSNAEFRVIDIYRRHGDKLAENWIFIDFLHFWKQQGVDVLSPSSDGE